MSAGDDFDRLEEVLHGRSLVVASNRGPATFEKDEEGEFVATRGAGGLVTALTQVMRRINGLWVASAMSSIDREMVRGRGDEHFEIPIGDESLRLRYLLFEREVFDRYYNKISNEIFWFLMHAMWNLTLEPRFGRHTQTAWLDYHAVNLRFAQALAEEVGGAEPTSAVMLHDYHLLLTARYLRDLSPDAFIYHFIHSPWAQPDTMSVLPQAMSTQLLEGMLANDLLGFQTSRWAGNFFRCCEDLLGAKVDWDSGTVTHKDRQTTVRRYPISIDFDKVREIAASKEAEPYKHWLEKKREGRRLILRVDRMEPSKNIVRGLKAFEELLHTYPEWKDKVVHVALLYPSRRALSAYRAYEAEVLSTVDHINSEFGTDDWQPVVVKNEDNYTRALACLTTYDVLVVNPIMDGMNLVAKEGAAVNETNGVMVLSQNAGAWEELKGGALGVNPFDLSGTADAIDNALRMEDAERARRAGLLREVVGQNTPARWMWQQLTDIRRLHEV